MRRTLAAPLQRRLSPSGRWVAGIVGERHDSELDRDPCAIPHGLRNCVPCADSSPFTRPRLGPKAKIPNHDGTRLRFARDSPLEQAGFELPVPLATVSL